MKTTRQRESEVRIPSIVVIIEYVENSRKAAFQAGVACVPGAILGSFLGGVIAKCFKMTGRQMMYFSTLSAVIVLIFYTLAMQISCGEEILAGVNTNYPGESLAGDGFDLTSTCNADCTCSLEYFNPVCADGITYFSPCHAGKIFRCHVSCSWGQLLTKVNF